MPEDKQKLPSTLKGSATKVRHTYEETLASAEAEYGDGERSHRTAWASVKHIAEKKGDHWELKDEPGPSDPRSRQPTKQKRAGRGETFGGIDVEGNTRAELIARAKKAGITGYSKMNKHELGRELARKEHD